MASCVFCDILEGRLPASMVYLDERCAAFMDIRPINPGHALVIPLQHAQDLAELDPEDGEQMFRVAQQVAAALYRLGSAGGLRCEAVNLFLADGAPAGQEVFHAHLHVIPRYRGDGFGLRFGPRYGDQPPRSALDQIAAALQAALSGPG
jgi:histidine triad (HIT) family protein